MNTSGTHAIWEGELAAIDDAKSGCCYQTPVSDDLTEAALPPEIINFTKIINFMKFT